MTVLFGVAFGPGPEVVDGRVKVLVDGAEQWREVESIDLGGVPELRLRPGELATWTIDGKCIVVRK